MSMETNWDWSEWKQQSNAHRLVVEFLTLDVQDNCEYIRHICNQIAALENGEIADCICSGNAYYVSLSPQNVTIENLIIDDEPIETISLNEFKQAILCWQDKLES